MKLLEFMLADDKELDLPSGAIVVVEEMNSETNPNFPAARSYIRYVLGGETMTSILKTKFEDVLFEIDANVDPSWLKLTRSDGMRLALPSSCIVGRMALDEGCQITVSDGANLIKYSVKESRRQIKKWSEKSNSPEAAPEPNPSVEE